MRNDKVLVHSFKKDDSMFHGLDGDRASPEPFQVLPRWLLQVHLDSNGTMDVDLISEEPRVGDQPAEGETLPMSAEF